MRASVREILDYYGIEYDDTPGKDELAYLCPFHNDHNLGSAYFNEDNHTWFCFSCNRGGNDVQFVAEQEDISNADAWHLIDTAFTGVRDYDKIFAETSKPKIKESSVTVKEFKDAVTATVARMLYILSTANLPIEDVAYWLRVCSWLRSIPVKDVKQRYLQIFEVHELFSKTTIGKVYDQAASG